MIYFQVRTWSWKQALTVFANASGELFVTGWSPEVCCRTTYIMNITFEIRVPDNLFCLINNGFMTSCLNDSSLMESQCTKAASTIASTVADQTEFYFLNGRNTARFFIRRMISSHIRQCIDRVHLTGSQRLGGWILHHIAFVRIWFDQTFCGKRIGIAVLGIKTACIGLFTGTDFFKGRQHDAIVNAVRIFRFVYSTVNISQVFYTDTTF